MLQLLVRGLFHLKGLVQYCILVRESRSISHSLRLSLNNPTVKFKRKTIHELLKLDNFSHSINIVISLFTIRTFFDTQLSEDFQSFSSELSVDKLSPSILRKLMNQHAFFKRNQIHIHLIILKSLNELYRGRETKTVSPNGI